MRISFSWIGLGGVPKGDCKQAYYWENTFQTPIVILSLLSIPSIYLEFDMTDHFLHKIGWAMNLLIFIGFSLETIILISVTSQKWVYLKTNWLNIIIMLSTVLSLFGWDGEWLAIARALRFATVTLLITHVVSIFNKPTSTRNTIPYLINMGIVIMSIAGFGFYVLEATVNTYMDGLWLAFVSSATVGYGDIVPTTTASRIFSVIMVLLGYTIISLITAKISALFVDQEEHERQTKLYKEVIGLHTEIKMLQLQVERLIEKSEENTIAHTLNPSKTEKKSLLTGRIMNTSIVVAAAKNGVIGANNTLIWHLSEDLKHFKQLTTGHAIIMGRKTYESIGRPLPNRLNIVVSRHPEQWTNIPDGLRICRDIDSAIQLATDEKMTQCFFIGGGEIYAQVLTFVKYIHLTEIHRSFEGDTFFPDVNHTEWCEIARKPMYDAEQKLHYDFVTYQRI